MTVSIAAPRTRGPSLLSLFAFLTFTSFRNRMLRQFRRLRQPRYAIAVAAGVLYFYGTFFRNSASHAFVPLVSTAAELLWAALLVPLAARWWIFGGDASSLAFSPAEVQFLFPAPLTRRQLVHYKLLRVQMVILINMIIAVVFLRRGSGPLPSPLRAIALWTVFSTLHLHKLGATLVRANATAHGRSAIRRSWLPVVIFGGTIAAVLWGLAPSLAQARASANVFAAVRTLYGGLSAPVPSAVLAPAHWLLAPVFAPDAAAWLRLLPGALGILLVHYLWVLRSDAAFEDTAVDASARRASRIARYRAARQGAPMPGKKVTRAWFPLAPTGRPAVAILWKNVTAVTRGIGARTVILMLILGAGIPLVFTATSSAPERTGDFLTVFGGLLTFLLVVMGPIWVRNDLRQDMPRMEVIRTYPLSGHSVVTAEVGASTVCLTGIQYALLLCNAVGVGLAGNLPPIPGGVLGAVATIVVLPAVNAVGLTVQNAAALLFPDWVRFGPGQHGGGVEAMGQNMLTMLLSVLLLILAVLPATIVGGGTGYLLYGALGISGAAIGFALAMAVLGAELWFLLAWLGRMFDRTDVSATGLT